MNNIFSGLKKFKPAHWLYNLWHYKSLLHNKRAFKQYNLHKPLFSSISSKDFPDKKSMAWLDVGDSKELVAGHPAFNNFSKEIQAQLLNWSANGFLHLQKFFSEAEVASINNEIEKLIETKEVTPAADTRIAFANRISLLIKKVTLNKNLTSIMDLVLGKEVVPFQTLNFIKGSNQRAHSDSIHMTTYPLGYLVAAW